MSDEPRFEPFKCFDRPLLVKAILVALAVAGITLLEPPWPRGSAARVALALFQAAAMSYLIVEVMRSLHRLDEFHQRLHFEALAMSFAAIGILVTIGGFLERAGVSPPPLGLWGWPLMVLFWWAGLHLAWRRYR